MLSAAKVSTSSWRYYSNSVARGACEYYTGAGEAPGRWAGRGLAELGLAQGTEVSEAQLEALFARALDPSTGEALGRRWRSDGVTGYDLTFSAPKSASLLWALGGPHARDEVVRAHRAAVRAALDYLDDHAALSRRGADGAEQIGTAGLVAALFPHRTSRAGDPQLHTHALVVNKLRCADGAWRTIDGHELYAHAKSAGAVYQAALRAELAGRLDAVFADRSAHAQAEVVGIPAELLAAFSKRSADIAAEAGPVLAGYQRALGRELTAAERAGVVQTAVLKTRPAKERTEIATLHERWRAEAAGLGWDGKALLAGIRRVRLAPPAPLPGVADVLEASITGAGHRAAAFSRADLVVELAARIPVYGASADQVREQLEALTDAALGRPDAVPLGAPPQGACPRRSDARYASAELLAAEARVLARAAAGTSARMGEAPLALVLIRAAEAGLDDSQTDAVVQATTSGAPISVWTAPAGAGKTTALGVAAGIWTEAGYAVVGLAPSARAAAELAAATGGPADTLAKWLHAQQRLESMPAAEAGRWAPTARTVLVVDEAGMASTFDLDALTAAAERAGAKVLLVGDPAQIGVVNGPGGLLAALAERPGAAQLTEVHRFAAAWERDASLRLRAGDESALEDYAAAGRIHPAPGGEAALDAVFARWEEARAAGADALMMARSRADVQRLNDRARAAGVEAGEIAGPAVELGAKAWQAGDVLLARRNDRRLAVGDGFLRNGDRFRVLSAAESGLVVQGLESAARALLPAAYVAAHADYGWASTVDGAQGATADVGVLLARPGLDREHLYVGLTRGRSANHVHVAPDPAELDEHAGRPSRIPAERGARAVLAAALAAPRAQSAAHQVREAARRSSTSDRRRPAQPDEPLSPGHQHTVDALAARQRQRAELLDTIGEVAGAQERVAAELAAVRWWQSGRRTPLVRQQAALAGQLGHAVDRLAELDRVIAAVSWTAADEANQRAAERQYRLKAGVWGRQPRPWRPDPELAATIGDTDAAMPAAARPVPVGQVPQQVAPPPPVVAPSEQPGRGVGR